MSLALAQQYYDAEMAQRGLHSSAEASAEKCQTKNWFRLPRICRSKKRAARPRFARKRQYSRDVGE